MPRRAGSICLVLSLVIFGVASEGAALPLNVAYIDSATGIEWAQVTDTTGFAWYEVAGVCPTDGATACGANLAGVEFNGWTWAQVTQIVGLIANVTDLAPSQFAPTATTVDSTWAAQFLSIFMPTLITDTRRAVIGWAADGASFDPRSAFAPEVVDAMAGMPDTAGRGSLFDSQPPFAPTGSETRGVWLFRDAQEVPEPSTLLLMGIGALSVMRWRAHRDKRSRMS
jgi:PEP-CTERM motif-containing protein